MRAKKPPRNEAARAAKDADPAQLPLAFGGWRHFTPTCSASRLPTRRAPRPGRWPAAGVGLVLALMSDFRIMAEGAFVTTSFSKLGLVAEHGVSWLLPRLVGPSRALDLLWTSRRIGAGEALRIGLVDRTAPDEDLIAQAGAFVGQLEDVSPHSMAMMKQMVYRHLDMELGPALRDAHELVVTHLSHPDVQEGVQAFKDRRAPQFRPWTGGD